MLTLIYARVSTEDQNAMYGIPVQLRHCREHAAKLGWTVAGEITDDGVSGTLLDRPGLDQVRKAVQSRQVDAVLMYDVDRLSRDLQHLLTLKREIERVARLEFVNARFEDSPAGRLFFSMRGSFAEYEREVIVQRTSRGRWERARAGKIVGGRVPYGYTYSDGRLTEDPERAVVVRRIYADYLGGMSIRRITSNLKDAPTWGGCAWGKSSVSRILANETYAGVAHYGTLRRDGARLRRRESGERVALTVPALIDRETWDRVQARLAENPQVGRPSRYLLRGLLRCHCGRRMAAEAGRSRSYRCVGRDRLNGCVCRERVNAPVADEIVWAALAKAFSNPLAIREALRARQAQIREVAPDSVESLRKRLAKAQKREAVAVTNLMDPELAEIRAELKTEHRAAATERRQLEAELSAVERTFRPQSPDEWLDSAAADIAALIAGMTEVSLRQEFIRRLVCRAEWTGEEIHMNCVIVPKSATTSGHSGQFEGAEVVVIARVPARVAA